MNKINYLIGDATKPVGIGPRIITHICNNVGGWGSGFVLAISKKWELPEKEYRLWASGKENKYPKFQLGEIQVVEVEENLFIANMIAQNSVRWINDIPPIRYDRVRQCLNKVVKVAKHISEDTTIHMPHLIGCGLAGGHEKTVVGLIEETLIPSNINVFTYKLPENN